MPHLLPGLRDDARAWIWIADRPLTAVEKAATTSAVNDFLSGWTTHGRPIRGGAEILFDQVVVLAGEVAEGDISGCGIDKSAHLLEEAAHELGFMWSSALDVALEDRVSATVRILSRTDLRNEIAGGKIGPENQILDRSTTRLGDIRAFGLLRPVRDTWASRYLVSTSPRPHK